MNNQLRRAALLSVTNKAGIGEFAHGLRKHGITILSTGGTAKELRGEGVEVVDVSDYTKFPEMMGGRLKTLHPMVHGGILGREEDQEVMERYGMYSIDFVVVNLYPFEKTVAKPGCTLDEAVEQIDIGGPTMLRASAKNYGRVTVVCSPDDYPRVLEEMHKNGGQVTARTRLVLAQKVFEHTKEYDEHIAEHLKLALESDSA
jgi:phosphoribosylaminoimidazolecarboxamide formyltransferase/IMP cyclohydrolase